MGDLILEQKAPRVLLYLSIGPDKIAICTQNTPATQSDDDGLVVMKRTYLSSRRVCSQSVLAAGSALQVTL